MRDHASVLRWETMCLYYNDRAYVYIKRHVSILRWDTIVYMTMSDYSSIFRWKIMSILQWVTLRLYHDELAHAYITMREHVSILRRLDASIFKCEIMRLYHDSPCIDENSCFYIAMRDHMCILCLSYHAPTLRWDTMSILGWETTYLY